MTMWGHYSEPSTLGPPLETKQKRQFAIARQNSGMEHADSGQYLQDEFDRGVNVAAYRNANINIDNVTESWTSKKIIDGHFDTQIQNLALAIKNDGRWNFKVPYFFSPHHEQHVDNDIQPSPGTPAEYPKMYEHVWNLFRDVGALHGQGGPVIFTFTPSVDQFWDNSDPWYVEIIEPPNKCYKVAACDMYNSFRVNTHGLTVWKRDNTFFEFDSMRKFAIPRKLRLGIGEWGCDDDPSDNGVNKAKYINNGMAKIKSFGRHGAGSFWWICWTNKVTDNNNPPDSSAASLAAWNKWALDPQFADGSAYN